MGTLFLHLRRLSSSLKVARWLHGGCTSVVFAASQMQSRPVIRCTSELSRATAGRMARSFSTTKGSRGRVLSPVPLTKRCGIPDEVTAAILYHERKCRLLVQDLDLSKAKYSEHLRKPFEYFWCIELSRLLKRPVFTYDDVLPETKQKMGLPSRDIGIDLFDLDHTICQVKLYHNRIPWSAIATFLACGDFVHPHQPTKVLCRNTESRLAQPIEDLVQKGAVLDHTASSSRFLEWLRELQAAGPAAPVLPSSPLHPSASAMAELRDYQLRAVAAIEQAAAERHHVAIVMATGTGKTTVASAWMRSRRGGRYLVLVPRLSLLDQWDAALRRLGLTTRLVGTAHPLAGADGADIDGGDHCKARAADVVVCVYNSFPLVEARARAGGFDAVFIDEAHRVAGPPPRPSDALDACADGIRRLVAAPAPFCVLLSATLAPPAAMARFHYPLAQAVDEGHLCDYHLILPVFARGPSESDRGVAQYLVFGKGETCCLVFARDQAHGQRFQRELDALQPGCAAYVDCDTPVGDRRRALERLESGRVRFVVNVRVLAEEVDCPACSAVVFLRVSSSDVFTVQAVGRALRPHPDKRVARVYLPLGGREGLEDGLSLLAEVSAHDSRLGAARRAGPGALDRCGRISVVRVRDGCAADGAEAQEDEAFTADESSIAGVDTSVLDDSECDFLHDVILGRSDVSGEERSLSHARKYRAFSEATGRRPKQNAACGVERSLGQWFQKMKQAKRGNPKCTMKRYESVERLLEDAFGEGWWEERDLEDAALAKCMEFLEFREIYGRAPKEKAACDVERKLAKWFQRMKQVKRGKSADGVKLYESVKRLLEDALGERWWETTTSKTGQPDRERP